MPDLGSRSLGAHAENYRKRIEDASVILGQRDLAAPKWKTAISDILTCCTAIVEVTKLHFESHDVQGDIPIEIALRQLEYVRHNLVSAIVDNKDAFPGRAWGLLHDETEKVVRLIPRVKTRIGNYATLLRTYKKIRYAKAGSVHLQAEDLEALEKRLDRVRSSLRVLHKQLSALRSGWRK